MERRRASCAKSWFEQSEALSAIVRGAGTKRQRKDTVLRDILPARRVRWAELLAWTSKAAEDEVEGKECLAFALVARELLGDRPPSQISIAVWIAKQTVAASTGR